MGVETVQNGTMRAVCAYVLAAAAAIPAPAQEFEVVSVKPNPSGSRSSQTNSDQGRLTASNASLRSLIVMAYGVKDYQVEGPDWLRWDRFDLAAKFPEALPRDRERYSAGLHAMLQKMLLERFELAVHRESRMFAVYGLTVGKSGIRFQEVPDGDSHNQNSDNNHYTGECVSMDSFAAFLARRMDLPVLDMTGLKGFYNLKLDWVAEPKPADHKEEVAAAPDPPQGMVLAVALQEQLGLKLERRKAPIEVLVVDHARKTPTEN